MKSTPNQTRSNNVIEGLRIVGTPQAFAMIEEVQRMGDEEAELAGRLATQVKAWKEHHKALFPAMRRLRAGLTAVVFMVKEVNHGRADRLPIGHDLPKANPLKLASLLVEAFKEDECIQNVARALGSVREVVVTHAKGEEEANVQREKLQRDLTATGFRVKARLDEAAAFITQNTAVGSPAQKAMNRRRAGAKTVEATPTAVPTATGRG